MMTEDAAARMGRMVRERRKALRLTQADVQSAGAPSTATLDPCHGDVLLAEANKYHH